MGARQDWAASSFPGVCSAHSSGCRRGQPASPGSQHGRGHRRPEPARAQWAGRLAPSRDLGSRAHIAQGRLLFLLLHTCPRHGLGAALISVLRLMLNSGCQRPSVCNGGLQVSQTETGFFQRKKRGLSLCQQLLPVPVEKAGTCSTNWRSLSHPGESG